MSAVRWVQTHGRLRWLRADTVVQIRIEADNVLLRTEPAEFSGDRLFARCAGREAAGDVAERLAIELAHPAVPGVQPCISASWLCPELLADG